MNINLSISAAPGITTNYIVIAVYNTTAPSTVVAYQSFAAPHTAPQNISFTNIPSGVYSVVVYQSPTSTPSGVTEFQFIYDPQWGSATVRVDLVLTGGISTGFTTGATSYVDNSLTGWGFSIERRGVGTLVLGTDYSLQTNGFTLLQLGDIIGANEIFILHFQPQITTVQPLNVTTGGQIFSGGEVLTIDTTLTANDMGKVLNIAASTAPVLNITLPASGAVVDFKMTIFVSEDGADLVANIIPAGSDQIKSFGDTWSNSDPFGVCKGESFWLYFDGNYWRVTNAVGNWGKIGELFFTDSLNEINAVQVTGIALLLRLQYPRLWRWINTRLDASLLVSDTTWVTKNNTDTGDAFYPNMGRYSTGDNNNTNFRLPKLHNEFDSNNNLKSGGFLRISDSSTNIAGVQHKDKVGIFVADIQGVVVRKSGSDNTIVALGTGNDPTFGNQIINNVPFAGKNPILNIANNETAPFARNIYCFIRY